MRCDPNRKDTLRSVDSRETRLTWTSLTLHVAVNSLQNMTNSLMIPPLPALWSRRPEVIIHPSDEDVR
jgi:hypothetical protein